MSFHKIYVVLILALVLISCSSTTPEAAFFPTYDPFLPLVEKSPTPRPGFPTMTPSNTPLPPTATREPTPTRAPVTIFTPINANVLYSPTPDTLHTLPTPRQDATQYTVQSGDTLGQIAMNYGISVETLMEANTISDPNQLEVGQVLNVPAPNPVGTAPSFKVLPNSELVYGPAAIGFNIDTFVQSYSQGYLANYSQDVNGTVLSGSEIVYLVARNYSVNPRLLLALLEYQSGWVKNPQPFNTEYPVGLLDEGHAGLYRQLTWAANSLNRGYYLWKANAISTVVLNDGTVAPLDPSINAGTAAIQYFFSDLDDRATWELDSGPTGLLLTYFVFFGNPFDLAIEPLVPASLQQPQMTFPFNKGETWYFTGGPHGGWDAGSAWASLDFAPPGDNGSCLASPLWVTAMANGLIVRASDGAVIQDLDNDGYEETGWTIFYMHIASNARTREGDYLFTGDYVGHPSCEGGVSNATHVHIARKYNGEWIPADGALPFNINGWVSSGGYYEYDGYLTKGNQVIEAYDGANDLNAMSH